MNLAALVPVRSDIQGALEHAYTLLVDVAPPDPAPLPTPDHWAIQGSLVFGPIIWLAKTYIRPDLIDWVAKPPTQADAQQLYTTLSGKAPIDPDLDNARRRLQPYLSQDTPTAVTLLYWLPAALEHASANLPASA